MARRNFPDSNFVHMTTIVEGCKISIKDASKTHIKVKSELNRLKRKKDKGSHLAKLRHQHL